MDRPIMPDTDSDDLRSRPATGNDAGKAVPPTPRGPTGEAAPGRNAADPADAAGELAPDALPRHDAMREATRLHGDVFLVKTDLEDQDQRDAAPGTREQP